MQTLLPRGKTTLDHSSFWGKGEILAFTPHFDRMSSFTKYALMHAGWTISEQEFFRLFFLSVVCEMNTPLRHRCHTDGMQILNYDITLHISGHVHMHTRSLACFHAHTAVVSSNLYPLTKLRYSLSERNSHFYIRSRFTLTNQQLKVIMINSIGCVNTWVCVCVCV